MRNLIQRQTNLPSHVLQFAIYLRAHGFDAGPNEVSDLLKAFIFQTPPSFDSQQALYKSIFVKSRKQYLYFNELYEDYWQQLSRAEDSKLKEVEEEKQKPRKNTNAQAPSLSELKSWLYNGRIVEEKETAAYSAFEALSKKDFSQFLSTERKELAQIIRIIAQRLANNYNRRYSRTKDQKQIDLRHTIREALGKGGEVNRFIFKKRQKKKLRLILICDVSKSMELYSRFLIEFMYQFQQSVFDLRTFAFSTKLTPLTRILRDGDYEKVLNNLADQVPSWSGGTQIGNSLSDLTLSYPYLLRKDTITLILSDGWDTGDLDVLESSMQTIHKKSRRVIWLNPLASNPAYSPDTEGMKSCMPYIDIFSSAHNAESLRNVIRWIK